MYRFTNHLSNAKLVLVRKKIPDGSCALLFMRRQSSGKFKLSDYEKIPTDPPRKPKKLLWATIGATIVTGSIAAYAKNSPNVRDWIADYAPWFDGLIAVVYQENKTYGQFAIDQFSNATKSISEFVLGKEGSSTADIETAIHQDLTKPVKKEDYKLPPQTLEPLYVEDVPPPPSPPKPAPVEEPPGQKITKDMIELEHDMHEATKVAIDNYKKATAACTEYNKALFKIVEATVDDVDKGCFKTMTKYGEERDTAGKIANEAAAKAKFAIDTLDRMVKSGVRAPPEAVTSTQNYIKKFRSDISKAEKNFHDEMEKAVLSDKYYNKVMTARDTYKQELQAIAPGIDINERQLKLKDDVDLLFLHTLRQVQFLQNELAYIQTVREQKLRRAIDCHDEKELIEAKVEDMIKKERLEMERQYQTKSLEIEAEANRKKREELKKQMELHQELLQDKLKKKEQEINVKMYKAVSEQVEKERVLFKNEMATLTAKLKAVEETLKKRVAAEEEARKSQALWAAGEALLATTRHNTSKASVQNEIKAIEKAAGKSDKLVLEVLKSIPPEVKEKGIVPQKSLREKFDQMEKTALKVALVGKEGGGLHVYFLSWLQFKMLFSKLGGIPQKELEDQPIDFSELDNFDVMQRARYYMEQGNISAALRYVNLLRGASRAAAVSWCEAAKGHLETRQAAEAVMTHAAAAAMLHSC